MICYRVTLPYACYGILANEAGTIRMIEKTAPIANWMKGKTVEYVTAWIKQRNGTIERITDDDNAEEF